MKRIFLFLICLICSSVCAQQAWDKAFSGHNSKHVIETYNHFYLYGGESNSIWNLTCLDSLGVIVHDTSFNPGIRFIELIPANDSGYLVLGADTAYWLYKFDRNDKLSWTKRFFLNSNYGPNDIMQTAKGDYVITARNELSNFHSDIVITRIDSLCNLIWEKEYSEPTTFTYAFSLLPALDSGFICMGTINNYGYWLLKLDENGDTLWTKKYQTNISSTTFEMIRTRDSCYVISGARYSGLYFAKINMNGDTIWTKSYFNNQPSRKNYCNAITEGHDGSFLAVGNSDELVNFPNIVYHAWIIMLDSSGEMIWEHIPSYSSGTWDVISTSDSMYLFTGYKNSYAWLVKFDSLYNGGNGIDNIVNYNKTFVYPNPCKDYLYFNSKENFKKVEIYDLSGKIVISVNKEHLNKINISALNRGIYILRMISENNHYITKISKE